MPTEPPRQPARKHPGRTPTRPAGGLAQSLKALRLVLWGAVAAVAALLVLATAGLVPTGWLGIAPQGSQIVRTLPGAAQIGGPFELTTHEGARLESRTLAGKPYALFFGFTHCPDVCPTTLLEVTNRLATLGPDADKLNVLFVSVDPARDTAAHLKTYLTSFDRRIIGLTGTEAEIATVARAFRAIYKKVPTSGGDYTMDHTALIYLMDRQGRYMGFINYQDPEARQLESLRRLIAG